MDRISAVGNRSNPEIAGRDILQTDMLIWFQSRASQ